MTDLAAQAAGALAESAVKTVAKQAKKVVAKRIPTSVKKAVAKKVAKAAKTPKKAVKNAAKKSSTRSAKKSKSSAGRKAVGTKKTTKKVAKKKKAKIRSADYGPSRRPARMAACSDSSRKRNGWGMDSRLLHCVSKTVGNSLTTSRSPFGFAYVEENHSQTPKIKRTSFTADARQALQYPKE
jgi:hypothetical protein